MAVPYQFYDLIYVYTICPVDISYFVISVWSKIFQPRQMYVTKIKFFHPFDDFSNKSKMQSPNLTIRY